MIEPMSEWELEAELRRTPLDGGFDGFYAARLVKITRTVEPLPVAEELPMAA